MQVHLPPVQKHQRAHLQPERAAEGLVRPARARAALPGVRPVARYGRGVGTEAQCSVGVEAAFLIPAPGDWDAPSSEPSAGEGSMRRGAGQVGVQAGWASRRSRRPEPTVPRSLVCCISPASRRCHGQVTCKSGCTVMPPYTYVRLITAPSPQLPVGSESVKDLRPAAFAFVRHSHRAVR